MKNRAFSISSILFTVVLALRLSRVVLGNPRDQIIENTCVKQTPQNLTRFIANMAAAMENVRQQIITTQGYGTATVGRGIDEAYAITQCYGDLSLTDCIICYLKARTYSPQCVSFAGGTIYLDGCFTRFGYYNFFQEYRGLGDKVLCGNRTRKNSAFQQTATQAVLQAASYASNDKGYARAQMSVSGTRNESAYVLAQCWATLPANSCKACLDNASTSILGCLPSSEGRALNTGCFMRYSDTNFLNPIPSNGSSSGSKTAIIAGVVSSTVVVAGAATIAVYIWNHRRIQKKRKGDHDVKKLTKMLRDSRMNFKYSTLEKATGGFDEANKLGQGGYGTVYKGMLQDGREIAVKRLFLNSRQRAVEFYNEVNIISCMEHKNLVRLLGCSATGPDSLLVYEFLPNLSLDHFIFDSNKGKALDWEKRLAIIVGTAEGLVYLHDNPNARIIHRDIKASNVLLDANFRAKIADFGLARAFQGDKSHTSTAVVGTLGYMAPEYLAYGQLTEKADVYSFGVLLLEIVTGQLNNGIITSESYSESLVTAAWKHFQRGTTDELIDPNLMSRDDYHEIITKNEVIRVMHIGLLCCQEIPSLRPSMSAALQMLIKKDEDLPPPTNPPFIYEKMIEINGMSNSSFPLISERSNSVATISDISFDPR